MQRPYTTAEAAGRPAGSSRRFRCRSPRPLFPKPKRIQERVTRIGAKGAPRCCFPPHTPICALKSKKVVVSSRSFVEVSHSLAHHNALPSGSALAVIVIRFRRTLRAVRVTTARAAAVEFDSVAGACDAVALASTAGGVRRHGAWRAVVAAAAAERWHVGS